MLNTIFGKIQFWISDWWPVGIISYRQARRLAEDVTEWHEISRNREKYPIGNKADRAESIAYGNCARTVEATLGRKRLLNWQKKWGNGRF